MPCSGVWCPKIDTVGPKGMTANAMNAGTAATTGARTNTTLSTWRGTMSSFNASLTPSARPCSRPCGPARFGPTRNCIRPMMRRSIHIVISTVTTRNAKIARTLPPISHHGSRPKSSSVGSAAAVFMGPV